MSEDVNLKSSDAYFATILQRLEAIEQRMGREHEETQAFRRDLTKSMDFHSGRISLLENDKSRVLGFAAGAGLAGGGIGAWLSKYFGHQ
jgi:hypothetical protein